MQPLPIGPIRKTRLERPYFTSFWGSRHKVKPIFIPKIFGDGRRLLAVSPLNTRPNYYLIRVDSSWNLSGYEDGEVIHDHIDEICEAIADEVGQGGTLDAETSPTGRAGFFGWPRLNDDCGSSWWDATELLTKS